MKTFLVRIIAINVLTKEIKVYRYSDGDLVVNSEDYIKISGTVLYTINDKGKGTVNFYGMDMNTMIPFATFSRVNIVYDDGENFSLSSYCEYPCPDEPDGRPCSTSEFSTAHTLSYVLCVHNDEKLQNITF